MANPTRAQAIAELTAPGQPYELQHTVIRGRKLRVFANAPASLRALYASTASDLPFIRYEDEQYTYAQAWAAAARIAQVLVQQCGVQPGDRVAISMRNYPEWMLAFNAATSIGAIAVAMNAHWQSEELGYGLLDSGAKVLLADQERLDRLAGAGDLPGLQVLAVRPTKPLAPGVRNLAELTAVVGDVPMPAVDIQPDDPATILYTSGSTGHPKGVVSSHRNIVTSMLSWELDKLVGERVSGITPPVPTVQPGTLLAVPLFHVTGLHASYLAGFRAQRRLVAMYRWDVEEAARLIDRDQLSSMIAPAAVSGDLLRLAQTGRYSLASLQVLGGGGAPRAPEQVRQIGKSFAQCMPGTGWGMTETNAIGCGIGGQDYLDRPASSGRSALVLDLKVVDEQGHALPQGERGELLVRGTSLFQGYWNRPEVNGQVFIPDPDGDWFRTGDVAYFDDEGFIFIVDRIKDLIIRGGENIGCGQVEAALLMHPQVHEAAVYAVPDERLGEEVGATVHGDPALDVAALRDFLAQHLAKFELPRYIVRSDQPLPRTPSGKVLKRQIRAAALATLLPDAAPSAPPLPGA
ncbi:MAG: class I adenylate-forming enzyme family protein [Pseudomonadota bacterium]